MSRTVHPAPLQAVAIAGRTSSGDAMHAQRSLERAQLAAEMGKWPTALLLARAVLDAVPDEPGALSLYGLCLAHTGGDLATALAACRRAVESQPYAAQWHAHLGAVYRAAGLAPQAAACFRAALSLDPREPLAAQALAGRGRAARLRDWFERRRRRRASLRPA